MFLRNERVGEAMRVLLISANREFFPEPVFPLGAVFVGEALRSSGASVKIFDMQFHRFPLRALKGELSRFRPSVVGISLRNIDNGSYPCTRSYLPEYAEIVRTVKSAVQARVILGGAGFTIFPEEILNALGGDAGIAGEGEEGAISLCAGNEYGVFAATPGAGDFPEDIEELFPSFRKYRTIGIQTSRGCPNRCIYCTYPILEGRRLRQRSPEQVAREMELLSKKYGKRSFVIVDSLFNASEGHLLQVLEEILRLGLDIQFSCYLQPRISDTSIIGLLKRAGCVAIDFGTDSGSLKMLSSMNKGFIPEDIIKASEACTAEGIDFCHSLIFGCPGETRETIRETVRLMDEVSPRAVVAMTGVRIYPGTEMEVIARVEGYIAEGESLLSPCFYFSELGADNLMREVKSAVGSRRNWFFPGERDRSASVGHRLLYFLYRKGPLWRTIQKIGWARP